MKPLFRTIFRGECHGRLKSDFLSAKRIVIHAGPAKTGTSAIQYWLGNNHEFLKERGVFYPEHGWDKNNVSSGNRREVLRRTKGGEFRVSRYKVSRLLKKFEKSGCHTLLLSSEFFSSKIQELSCFFSQAEFVLYLRNPVELLESSYNQRVKRRALVDRFSLPESIDQSVWDALEMLMNSDVSDRIIIRPYAESLFCGGSIICDLLKVIGVDLSIERSCRINSSYSFGALEFMRFLNHFPAKNSVRSAVDKCLQGCSKNSEAHSLLTPKKFVALNQDVASKLEAFIISHGQFQLEPLVETIKHAAQRPYRKQEVRQDELDEVVSYINTNEPELYKKLHSLISDHRDISLENTAFYEAMNVHLGE